MSRLKWNKNLYTTNQTLCEGRVKNVLIVIRDSALCVISHFDLPLEHVVSKWIKKFHIQSRNV